jgi:hypothetical protein
MMLVVKLKRCFSDILASQSIPEKQSRINVTYIILFLTITKSSTYD